MTYAPLTFELRPVVASDVAACARSEAASLLSRAVWGRYDDDITGNS